MSEIELFSYSKLETYINCQFKYKLKYIDGYYLPSDGIATEFGSAVHATEEKIAQAIGAGEPIDYIAIKNAFLLETLKLQYKYPADWLTKDKSDRTYQEKTRFYLETGVYRLEKYMKEHPSYKIIGQEVEFNFEYDEEHALRGFIDRLIYDTVTKNYIIQDIKTYAVPIEDDKLITPLQFVVYALAVQKMYPDSVGHIQCSYDLPFCDLIQKAGTSGFINRGKNKLNTMFKELLVSEFKPTPSPFCYWCEYCKTNPNAKTDAKYLCPYFMRWTRAKRDFSKENLWIDRASHKTILESYLAKNNITIEAINNSCLEASGGSK